MPRRNRGYKKEEPFRDARFIAIACEGLREAEYFRALVGKSRRLKLVMLEPKDTEDDSLQRSSPKWVRSRAAKFIAENDLFGKNKDDELWFVMDVDRWEKSILHAISKDCKEREKWSMALSNSCFEGWLYGHFGNPKDLKVTKAKELKARLNQDFEHSYKAEIFVKNIKQAIEIAQSNDSDVNSDFPNLMETKVYQLAQSITNSILKP